MKPLLHDLREHVGASSTEGDPKFEGSQDLPSFPYAQYGRMLGLGGFSSGRDIAA